MRFLVLITVLFMTELTSAQSWTAVGSGVDDRVRCFYSDSVTGKLYVGGHFYTCNYSPVVNAIASWNGSQWDSLSEGTVLCSFSSCYPVLALEKYNGDLYAGGMFYGMQNTLHTHGIAKWNDTTWSSVGDVWGYITDMAVYNNKLFVVGNFDSIDGVSAKNIAVYDGNSWQAVADTLFESGMLNTIDVYQGKLYVGGVLWDFMASTACVFNFDGTAWADIGASDFTDTTSTVYSMHVFQNELYVGGTFHASAGAPGESIARWNGSTWSGVGGGILDTLNYSASVLSMCIHDNKLVVGGGFKKAGGIYARNIALWDGSLWCGLGNPFPVYVEALVSHDDTLYAGGAFTSVEGNFNHRYIAKWIAPNAIDTCGVMGMATYENVELVGVYPNPANEIITFQFWDGHGTHSLILYDQIGREVWRKETDERTVEFPASEFASGMYFYTISEVEGRVSTGKFIVEH
jgi:hypothetical protein